MRRLPLTFIFLFCSCSWLWFDCRASGQANPNPVRPASDAASQSDSNPPPLVIFDALRQAVEENYPVLEFIGWQGDRWNQEFCARIAAAPTREAAFELMDEYVCRLNDIGRASCREREKEYV